MAKKTIFIAFPRGGILPADVINQKRDYNVPANTPVPVPTEYGLHLINDKFAYDATDLADELIERAKAEQKAMAEAAAAAAAATASAAAVPQKAADDAAKAEASDEVAKAEAALVALKA